MQCRYRIPRAPGTYYVSRRTEPPLLIFTEPRDYKEFETYLARVLKRTGTRLLGYCLMPDSIHLALGISATPLGEVMRQITGCCSRRIRQRTGAKVIYTDSFPVALPEPEVSLPMLLRYIHGIPVIAGVAERPGDYPYSSHRT